MCGGGWVVGGKVYIERRRGTQPLVRAIGHDPQPAYVEVNPTGLSEASLRTRMRKVRPKKS